MLPADLGDGLVLRTVQLADTEQLVAFKADTHRAPGAPEPDAYVAGWTRDLLERPHPTFLTEWFLVVEDTATGRIVSSLNMIPQTWTYGGLQIPVGRVEMVSTDPAYRRRGLVRRQIEVVHRWGDEIGHLAQVIIGINWYYRQFGYEYAVGYGGRRIVDLDHIPNLPAGKSELYRLRPATPADLPFFAKTFNEGGSRYAVTCHRDESIWRYELEGRTDPELLFVVDGADGEAVGILAHSPLCSGGTLTVNAYELARHTGVTWHDVTPSVLRGLRELVRSMPDSSGAPISRLAFLLGESHPVYRTHDDLARPASPPYAWYVRVPDLPRFIRHVAPVLEARLAHSDLAGFSGEVRFDFFRDGLRLAFDQGTLVDAAKWRPDQGGDPDALFPDLTFLQVLLGRRTQADIEAVYPDCQVTSPHARALLETVFPRVPSLILPVM